MTLLEKKKELKKVLLIRQPLSIDLCRDLYLQSHLEILPSHTLHSMVPWKEENHDLHLETLYSSGLIPSFRLPSLHYSGDLSCLPSSTLSPIEVSRLLHGFACMLYQYGASLLSSFILTCIDISSMLALFILEVVSSFGKVYMHFFYHPHVVMLCMPHFSSHVGFLRFSFYGNSSSCVHSFSNIHNFFAYSSFPLVIDLSPLLREAHNLVDPSYFYTPFFACGYYIFDT